ncbi:isomerase [Undibacterium sp. YM2]|uniref:2-hydroxychromene-2-carboxylate isomerase n=1 Tax=Undibacterium sp. YM2 TaxID=2058625 RepID=UPI001331D051|nr:DsbA family protein [Undibacterium sp. YM2]BBB69562.1 isomerase [Undibacterium sp. YM2]
MKQLDWYFDFISPFAYLQSEMLHQLQGVSQITYRPVLFAGLLNHWDNKGPAEIAPKRQWTFEHCVWLAHKHGIPLRMLPEHPFNPLPLLRLCLALGSTQAVVQRLFRFVWRDGHIPAQTEHWQALLDELQVTPAMLDDAAVKEALKRNGELAIAARVFGVPTAVVDGRCFGGLMVQTCCKLICKATPSSHRQNWQLRKACLMVSNAR